jgi:hypothetical protein
MMDSGEINSPRAAMLLEKGFDFLEKAAREK